MPKKIENKREYCSKSGLKYRGWTDLGIELLLGSPDKKAQNPHYRSGPEVNLFLLSRVVEAEKSETYKQFLTQNQSRRDGAKRAIKTKRAKLFEYVETCKIHVVIRPIEKVVNEAIEAYNWHKFEVSQHYGYDYEPAKENSPKCFLDRVTVNYLRHNLSEYDDKLVDLFGKVGTEEAYKILNKRIYAEIAKAYPCLKAECENQLAKKLGVPALETPLIAVAPDLGKQTTLF